MNNNMRGLYESACRNPVGIPDKFALLLADGLVVKNRCVFLNSLLRMSGNGTLDDFDDEVGYECFVNHFHIDSNAEWDALSVSLSWIEALGRLWETSHIGGTLRVILSVNEGDCTLRFHLVRKGQSWIDENLEMYGDEGILVADLEGGNGIIV